MIIRPGVHRLLQLLEGLEALSSLALPAVLVTGSNGKGSTCALVESALRAQGLKTGLYTSPHLCHVNERIRISGQPVDALRLEEMLLHLKKAAQKYLPDATVFEHLSAAAFLLFAQEKVDFVVCEVGLGGRFDSTNALSNIQVSCLTSVCLEHTSWLGSTESAIAFDKSHIARFQKPFLISESLSPSAREGCQSAIEKIQPHVTWVSHETLGEKFRTVFQKIKDNPVAFGLNPNFSLNWQNSLMALHVLDALEKETSFVFKDETIQKGFSSALWPGRFDVRCVPGFSQKFLFDVAHNPGGVAYFLEQYQKSEFASQPYILVASVLKDKEWKEIFGLLAQKASCVILVPFEHEDRGLSFEELEFFVQEIQSGSQEISQQNSPNFWRVAQGLSHALELVSSHTFQALSQNALVCVSGSVAFVGHVMTCLHIDPFAPKAQGELG